MGLIYANPGKIPKHGYLVFFKITPEHGNGSRVADPELWRHIPDQSKPEPPPGGVDIANVPTSKKACLSFLSTVRTMNLSVN